MIKKIRFFGGFLDTQENWLNEMADQGYRLVKTGKIDYVFECCQPNEYRYCVEFVADQSYRKEKEYRQFLEELGYTVFYKNINWNYSVGKVRWRPFAKGSGQIATNPGSYNKELFIVEKKNDGLPFELHTTYADKAAYYKPLRNAWLCTTLLFAVLCILLYIQSTTSLIHFMIWGGLALLSIIPAVQYQKRISKYTKLAQGEE